MHKQALQQLKDALARATTMSTKDTVVCYKLQSCKVKKKSDVMYLVRPVTTQDATTLLPCKAHENVQLEVMEQETKVG